MIGKRSVYIIVARTNSSFVKVTVQSVVNYYFGLSVDSVETVEDGKISQSSAGYSYAGIA